MFRAGHVLFRKGDRATCLYLLSRGAVRLPEIDLVVREEGAVIGEIGLFAPTSRHGSPEEFAAFVEAAHAAGLGVLIDWVPGHFPTDQHGLGWFDGTALYEHADPRLGFQKDWNTLIYNYGRTEVQNFLLANGLYWMNRYIERAENMARLVDAGLRMALTRTQGAEDEWKSVLLSAGADVGFSAKYAEYTVGAVSDFLIRDTSNPSSSMSSMETARFNARMFFVNRSEAPQTSFPC